MHASDLAVGVIAAYNQWTEKRQHGSRHPASRHQRRFEDHACTPLSHRKVDSNRGSERLAMDDNALRPVAEMEQFSVAGIGVLIQPALARLALALPVSAIIDNQKRRSGIAR